MKFPFHNDRAQMQIAREEFYLQIEKKETIQIDIQDKQNEVKRMQKELEEVQKEIERIDKNIFFIKTNK